MKCFCFIEKLTDNFLVVADGSNATAGLYQVDLLTGRVKQLLKQKVPDAAAIAFDFLRKDIYFSDLGPDTIEKYSLATGEVTRIHSGGKNVNVFIY